MPWIDLASRVQSRFLPFSTTRRMRIRSKLLAVLIPSVVAILLITGYFTYSFSQQFLQTALERIGTVQTLGVAAALEAFLATARRDLLFYADQAADPEAMRAYLKRTNALRQAPYREFGYLDLEGHDHVYLITDQHRLLRLSAGDIDDVRPSPFQLLDQGRGLKAGEVRIGPITRLDYHYDADPAKEHIVSTEVLRLITPRMGPSGKILGIYVLSIGARDLRNILSLYNSDQSPLHGFKRSPEVRYGFLFDTEGWVLFQSEDLDKPLRELTTYLARAGYSGTLGRRGMESAFRPESGHKNYWKMVEEVREGRSGIINKADTAQQEVGDYKAFYMPYAPVRFQVAEDAPPVVVAGVACMDKSQMTLRAGYKQIDVIFIITMATICVVSGIIYLLSRTITRPIIELSRQVTRIETSGELAGISLPDHDYETSLLKNALNRMIEAIKQQMAEIRARDRKLEHTRMREQASLEPAAGGSAASGPFPEIKGAGPLVDRLKADLAKAAQVEADVLITGETGTGKQLAAEAIHRSSRRFGHPFISINCGALDENLLLDTLFGHVKGAFTEAKADRKGAFVEAEGGILFLDEIQTATPKVQQALLRAIAMRRVRPLGSDREIAVDVRLIAATNVDLREFIEAGRFREDLYFRLKVISITTPPLRLHKESISILVRHFLKQAGASVDKPGLGLSRGALAKLSAYNWPGNTRELKHCILRAAVMSEQSIIQDADILLDGEIGLWQGDALEPDPAAPLSEPYTDPPTRPPHGGAAPPRPGPTLNPRQARALPAIVREGSVTRGRYQELVGNLPQRTAAHDLRDMVEKGLLARLGSGPATRYEPTAHGISAAGLGPSGEDAQKSRF